MNATATAPIRGTLSLEKNGVALDPITPPPPSGRVMWSLLWAFLWDALPKPGLTVEANAWRRKNFLPLLRGYPRLLLASLVRAPTFTGFLRMKKYGSDGQIHDLGPACALLITTAGVNKIVSGLNATDTATFSSFKYHAFGTGAVAPAIGDTLLGAEATTQYATASTRPTGTQTTGGSNNIYQTVGTFTPSAAYTPTEMGLFSAAASGATTLLDRFTFTGVALNGTGDSLQTTIAITFAAGG